MDMGPKARVRTNRYWSFSSTTTWPTRLPPNQQPGQQGSITLVPERHDACVRRSTVAVGSTQVFSQTELGRRVYGRMLGEPGRSAGPARRHLRQPRQRRTGLGRAAGRGKYKPVLCRLRRRGQEMGDDRAGRSGGTALATRGAGQDSGRAASLPERRPGRRRTETPHPPGLAHAGGRGTWIHFLRTLLPRADRRLPHLEHRR